MSNLFKDLSTNLARFVYAWVVPSAAAVGVFATLVLPDLRGKTKVASLAPLEAVGVFAIAVLLLSILFAYASLPLYRVLEGYTVPRRLSRRLLRRSLREWHKLQALKRRRIMDEGELLEKLAVYPTSAHDVLPTRLGNALRAMERYGVNQYGLDPLSLWYELNAVAPESLRQDLLDARASVDFFVSALGHLALLGAISIAVAVVSEGTTSAIVGLVSALLLPAAYRGAVLNVPDWRRAIQALVNLGRSSLPSSIGLELPGTFKDEERMWTLYTRLVEYGTRAPDLDAVRAKPGGLSRADRTLAAAAAVNAATAVHASGTQSSRTSKP
jgi:hypothetical protein